MNRCPYKIKENLPKGKYWIWWWSAKNTEGFAILFTNFEKMKTYSAKHGSAWVNHPEYFSDYEKIEN